MILPSAGLGATIPWNNGRRNRLYRPLLSRFVGLTLFAVPAIAQLNTFSSPAPPYTTATTVITFSNPNGGSVSSISGGGQTVTFSTAVLAETVPGGGWATWGAPPNTESATPRVLAAFGATSLTLTLSAPVSTFGFEVEPDAFASVPITATFMNGATVLGTVTRTINGNAGALLAAASDSTPITSVVITAPSGADGFAIAQVRSGATFISSAPVPPTIVLAVLGLASLALFTWRGKHRRCHRSA